MDIPIWRFDKRNKGMVLKDPVQGEFFNTDSINHSIGALVRESIQNSLDARDGEKVRVRFSVSGIDRAVPREVAAEYFEGFWPHFDISAADEIEIEQNLESSPCEFLVVEDFNTSGLTGDQRSYEAPSEGQKNHYFYFFRAEGLSGKSGNDKGRWGIGKYVYPKLSEVRSFFGLTRRSTDAATLLMGRSVMKNHVLADELYLPDGWFADFGNDDNFPEPIVDESIISKFKKVWDVSRTSEPGLSIVVPYVRGLKGLELCRSVIEQYFVAIISGELEVEVLMPDSSQIELNQETIKPAIENLFNEGFTKDRVRFDALMMEWAVNPSADRIVEISLVSNPSDTSVQYVDQDAANRISSMLAEPEGVVVRIPVEVVTKPNSKRGTQGGASRSYFDVILREDNHRSSPMFIREGILVPAVKSTSINGIRAIVLISHSALASLLGDAEGPAHTDWSAQRDKFRGKYESGADWIRFVKNSPKRLLEMVRGGEESSDVTIAADWFPDNSSEEGKGSEDESSSSADKNGKTQKKKNLPNSKRKVRIDRFGTGFTLKLTEQGREVTFIEANLAYDLRRGNPLAAWSEQDFSLTDLKIDVTEGKIIEKKENRIIFSVDDPNKFVASVQGFDPRRDLYVDDRTI